MKRFILDEYLKNPSRKVVTRDGKTARIICTDYYGEAPIIAKIEECEYSYPFYEDGNFLSCGEPSHLDLFFAPEKQEGWINLYKMNSIISPGPRAYDTKLEAESAAGDKSYYISTIKIEWEE